MASPSVSSVLRSVPKARPAGDVDGEALQIARRVHSSALLGGALPASSQPLGDVAEARRVLAQMIRVEGMHRQLALAPPVTALRRKHAVNGEIQDRVARDLRTLETTGAIAQYFTDQTRFSDDDNLAPAEAKTVDRAELVGPARKCLVRAWSVDLQQIAQQWPGLWPGKVV
jgi:hypothetical protein